MFYSNESFRPIVVDDVTYDEEGLHEARMLVAESYVRLSSQKLEIDDVYRDLADDHYRQAGLARTFLARGYNPSTGEVENLGTARLVIGSRQNGESGLKALEMIDLIEPAEGWDNFEYDGCRAENAAEIGRFVLSPRCAKGVARELGFSTYVIRCLVETCMVAAQLCGARQTWAIMPRYVAKAGEAAAFNLTPAREISLKEKENAELFKKYDRYWIRSKPWLYRMARSPQDNIEVPQAVSRHMNVTEQGARAVAEKAA